MLLSPKNVKKDRIVSKNVKLKKDHGKFQIVMKMENAGALNVTNVWIAGIFVRRTKILNAIKVDAIAVNLFLNPKNVFVTVTARKEF